MSDKHALTIALVSIKHLIGACGSEKISLFVPQLRKVVPTSLNRLFNIYQVQRRVLDRLGNKSLIAFNGYIFLKHCILTQKLQRNSLRLEQMRPM